MGNPLMPQQPQGQAPQGPAPALTADQYAQGHQMADTFLQSLMQLAAKPRGELSKQDVFQSAADMLGKGLFNDPQARANLVAQLTALPEDEASLRQALGKEILQVSQFRESLTQHAATNGVLPPQGAANG